MSHSVTIRTQTVTSSSSTIVVNTGYLKTWSGILKLLQLALGIVCVGIAGHEFSNNLIYRNTAELFFLLITTTFMIGTFILLLSCLTSFSTASIMSKTIYELLYHSIAFGLVLAASLTLLVHVNNYKRYSSYELLLGASICGLVNAGLYLFSTIIALRTYRGI
ncbi:PREDICTED: uncharacterized protein LOC108762230 [Trachymyrmex cornetzi]|uniref:uncharacterized protein LOC108762230 n=1 Tax=Trachymyrmex cornetzi TaxID=471704 RepID=UPI00084F4B3E|nr:PREDICTED: uncharacterized protein LOC108762230 [Trachymyrmex cornetzi]XP_018364637.1 PREDICTED: uncharacterized protein LOC108762230 [Trachymyrmex cornetzi]XP_018364638.1 PREDICTED: uncharacterized protein LOC108762230 [Trachymyrmex cornetzi]XP_018364639.1 PREDICTED: uncharacterized protein LOC108762230 [Trachymyrmex cornetzi]XP_018364640.1 PREDICTED: uncharacterized protein LOC108762230 [Trachymyrmex cornetzi]